MENEKKEFNWLYSLAKDTVAILWIVSFVLITHVKVPLFYTTLIFALYPILISMFFIDRYHILFVGGISVAIAEWVLENYYLMSWYFLLYGIGAFIAYNYINPDQQYRYRKNIFPNNYILRNVNENTKRNNSYLTYSIIWLVVGSSLVDLITLGSEAMIIKFPFHLVEIVSSSIAGFITVYFYEQLIKKRSQSSSNTV